MEERYSGSYSVGMVGKKDKTCCTIPFTTSNIVQMLTPDLAATTGKQETLVGVPSILKHTST